MALPDRFPVAIKTALQTMRDYTGVKVKFKAPSDQDRATVRHLIQALTTYDRNPRPENVQKIMQILKKLNMTGFRLREDHNCLIFVPKDVTAQGDGITLLWRLGKVQVPGKPETYNNPVMSAFISNEHMKKDFADNIAIRFFMETNIKGMLCNGVAFGCSPEPSPCQKTHKITDVAHSDVPLYYSAMQAIVKNYPEAPISNLHGMQARKKVNGVNQRNVKRAIFLNNYGGQFLPTGQISWPTLFAVAMAQQNFPVHTIAFGSRLPGSIVTVDGETLRMAAEQGTRAYFIKFNGSNNVTNVPGHVANLGTCARKGQWLDKSLHMEWGPEYRDPGVFQDRIVAAFKQALYFYLKYIPAKHNPWSLPPEISANMRKYPEYFEKQLQPAPMLFSAKKEPTCAAADTSVKTTANANVKNNKPALTV